MKILSRLGGSVLFLGFLLILISIYESTHISAYDISTVGSQVSADTDSSDYSNYSATTLEEHRSYLSTFSYENKNIRYLDRGPRDGIPLLLVHGTPTNSRLWRKMITPLIERGYRVIAPDQFGFGMSDKSALHEDLTIDKQSERLIALMDHLEIDTFAIAGHDQGSLRVRETITTHPERISHLIIMNSIGDWDGFHPPAGFGSPNIGTHFTSRAMGSKPLGRIFAYGAMMGGLHDSSHATSTMINGYLYPLLDKMHMTYYDFITHFDQIENKLPERHSKFPTLDIPATIIRGAHDKILVGEEQAPVLADLFDIADTDVHLLDTAAHFIQEEVPEEIVELIDGFVKRR